MRFVAGDGFPTKMPNHSGIVLKHLRHTKILVHVIWLRDKEVWGEEEE
jgi:hypothetical protein